MPDTFLYLSIADSIAKAESVAEIRQAGVGTNSIAPGLVWLICQRNWYLVSLFNTVCFVYVLIYTRRLVVLLDPFHRHEYYSIGLILTVVCMYYSVGALKEIPTLLGFTAFVYCFLKKQRTRALMWFTFLTAFRFQFAYVIPALYALSKVRRNPLRLTFVGLAIVGALFPLISFLDVFTPDALGRYRLGQNPGSLGAQIEFVRGNILGLSLVAILIRVLQSILEPLIRFLSALSFYEEGSLSVFHVHAALVLLLMLRTWIVVLFKRFRLTSDTYASFGILCSFVAVAVFATGGAGLISHRFLVPVYGLLLVAAHVNPVKARGRRPKPWVAPPMPVARAS